MERPGAFPDPQRELVKEYCSEARQLLKSARDWDEAKAIAERVCARFSSQCESSLVLTVTHAYIEKVLQEEWGSAFTTMGEDQQP
jgi:hypothetical protein